MIGIILVMPHLVEWGQVIF